MTRSIVRKRIREALAGALPGLFVLAAPVSAQRLSQAEGSGPATRIERILDEAYLAATGVSEFSCSTKPRVRRRIVEINARYERLHLKVEQLLGRQPFQSIVVSDCRVFEPDKFVVVTGRATDRLDKVEAMLRRGERD